MVTLVPSHFFNPDAARETLAEVAELNETDKVFTKAMPQYDAVLIYSISGTESEDSVPEMFSVISALSSCSEYNKIVASLNGGVLNLAIAQGGTILLANEYSATDFTTALYFIFLAMKSLQLNPEVSTISWKSELDAEDEVTLYRYFKAVDRI